MNKSRDLLTRPLEAASLPALATSVSVPSYDRDQLTPAVVHIGVGGFHRAHQATYFDKLAELGFTEWGLVGSGLRSRDMLHALSAQDCLFTVVERGTRGDAARVVGVMQRYLYGPEESAALLDALADPITRVVTLTITAHGYPRVDGHLDLADPDIAADLGRPGRPGTAIGYLVEALARRRSRGLAPFTVVSCDNLPDNGAAARACVLDLAESRSPSLAAWIERHVGFPGTMVDRITPPTSERHRRWVEQRFGVRDRCPVLTESFSQWVVEDQFSNGRPPLDEVGVSYVTDVDPYKQTKMRLLNGSHCALGYLGWLSGYRTAAEAMADPLISEIIEQMMSEEIAPLLSPTRALDVTAYQRSLLRRFASPSIADPLSRLCARGSTRMPPYLLTSLTDAMRLGRPHALLALVVAAWMRYLRGIDLQGRPIELVDVRADLLRNRATRGGRDPRPLLAVTEVFGTLRESPELIATLERALCDIDYYGLRLAMSVRAGVSLEGVGSVAAS